MIAPDNVWALWAIILFIVALSIYLEQEFEFAAKISGAVIALLCAMLLSNLGIIPLDSPVYDTVWGYVVPMSIPLLLFQCNIREIWKDSGRLLIIFLLSSLGTMVGAILGFVLLKNYIPELSHIAGVMSASYIGGGVNFVAVSSSFNLDPKLISAATVSDNLLMVLYFFVLIIMPTTKFFNKHFIRTYDDTKIKDALKGHYVKKETSLKDISFAIASSVIIVFVSFTLSAKFNLNKYLVLTTITIVLATALPNFFGKIKGTQEIGTFLIYIFFVVIGVPASIKSIILNSPLLLVFCLIMVVINMLFTLVFAKIFNFSLEEAILVSNANIGGPTTAVAMAISKGWIKYVAPVMLVGTLGYIIGTYFGILIGNVL